MKGAIAQKEPVAVDMEPGRKYYWCSCGLSSKQPWCDGSHKAANQFSPVAMTVEAPKKAWLCQCKQTNNAGYCDGSHKNL
ncbi:MAG: CDGSH iron-sulfur domain-containing protein [Bacteroidetes bacterium]|nr:CDGSH iron-sulfur domain-containing protein [Bacteroidota bacterium]